MSSTKRYGMKGRVVLRRIGEDVLLVPVSGMAAEGGGRVYPLNATAHSIWDHLMAGKDVPGIVEVLMNDYEVTREQLEADVAGCVCTFLDEHLIERLAS